jgi:hypothetical protein
MHGRSGLNHESGRNEGEWEERGALPPPRSGGLLSLVNSREVEGRGGLLTYLSIIRIITFHITHKAGATPTPNFSHQGRRPCQALLPLLLTGTKVAVLSRENFDFDELRACWGGRLTRCTVDLDTKNPRTAALSWRAQQWARAKTALSGRGSF